MRASAVQPLWQVAPAHLRLLPGEVHLWRFALAAAPTEAFWPLLTFEEQQQVNRLLSQKLQRLRLAGRGLLRLTLGRYLHCPPETLRFCSGPYGKPALDPPLLHFNLSHSGDLMLLAVAADCAVGVDLEQCQPDCAWQTVAQCCCTPAELAQLQRLPPAAQLGAFYACWTAKEAFAKALGWGLALPLRKFALPLHGDSLLRTDDGRAWLLRRLDPGPSYAAALVAGSEHFQLRCWSG